MRRIIHVCLILILCCSLLAGCTAGANAADLMEDVNRQEGVQEIVRANEYSPALNEFTVKLFKSSYKEGENQLISPLSVMSALGMTANGAGKETLAQFESAFGVPIETLDQYMYNYIDYMTKKGQYCNLKLADSIWISERFKTVSKDFLQKNADFYGADVYRREFDDSTLNAINQWVNEKTDGMIPKILDKIEKEDLMFLVNALSFDAVWEEIYNETAVREGIFTKEDGTEKKVEFMSSAEYKYIEGENASGFIKHYKGRKYAFVALLPKAGISISDYVAALDGKNLADLIASAKDEPVYTKIPKVSFDYTIEMSETLKKLGIIDAFDPGKADFSGMLTGEENDRQPFIGSVLHKTYICVDEQGTKAGAATIVEMKDGATLNPTEPTKVYLDRPFLFMLIDTKSNIPFFIGTVMDVGE